MDNYQKKMFRFFLGAKICPENVAIEALEEIYDDSENPPDLIQCIAEMNQIIKKLDIEIVSGQSELTGTKYLSLIQLYVKQTNSSSKSSVKKASDFFSLLVTTISLTIDKKITETEAVNAGTRAGLNKVTTQAALSDLKKDMWFEFHGGYIYLGVRAILELGQFIASNYPNVSYSCPLCRKQVFHGVMCDGCQNKTHKYCLDKFSRHNPNRKCPACHIDMDNYTSASTSQEGPSQQKRPKLH